MSYVYRALFFGVILSSSIFTSAQTGLAQKSDINSQVVIGDEGLIDGTNVKFGKELQASYLAEPVVMYDNGTFSVKLFLTYISENPTNLKLISSIAMLRVNAEYIDLDPTIYGDSTTYPLTSIIPVVTKIYPNNIGKAYYQGTYDLPKQDYKHRLLLKMQISWIRVFEDSKGVKYYQWMQAQSGGNSPIHLNELSSVSGWFLVYYPMSEDLTTTTL